MASLLTLKEVATHLGIAENTLRSWRVEGKGPEGFNVGRRVMYRPEVVEHWLADQEAATSSNSSARRERETRPGRDTRELARDGEYEAPSGNEPGARQDGRVNEFGDGARSSGGLEVLS